MLRRGTWSSGRRAPAAGSARPASETPWRLPLFLALAAPFTLLIALAIGAITLLNWRQDRLIGDVATTALADPIMAAVSGDMQHYITGAAQMADLLAASVFANGRDEAQRLTRLPLITRALEALPGLSSIYVGTGDGAFIQVRDLQRRPIEVEPREGARYSVRSILPRPDQPPLERMRFYDDALQLVGDEAVPYSGYDPRERPWYRPALAQDRVYLTSPYKFGTGYVGMTASRHNAQEGTVLGVDFHLSSIDALLTRLKPTQGTQIALLDSAGQLLGASGGLPLPALLRPLAGYGGLRGAELAAAQAGPDVTDLRIDGTPWKGVVRPITLGERTLQLAMALPAAELMQDIDKIRRQNQSVLLLVALLALALTVATAAAASRRLRQLERGARRVQALDFGGDLPGRSRITEIDRLETAFRGMQGTIRRLLEIGRTLANERDIESLSLRLLEEAGGACHAVLGVLVLTGAEPGSLTATHAAGPDGAEPLPEAWRSLSDSGETAPIREALERRQFVVAPPETALLQGCLGARRLVVFPFYGQGGDPLGALCLALPGVAEIDPARLRFVQALCGFSAIAIDHARLAQQHRALLDSIIHVMASAIDARSAYTGAHCQRVPELTLALAEAAQHSPDPALAGYRLSSQQTDELMLAAWLHDCGKLTTPDWVVDKATRLECVTNRIHEIRTRFEVLWRDAEIAALRQGDASAWERCRAEQARLQDDFAFVAACNQGETEMDDTRRERLRAIAAQGWTRFFDDGLGLSEAERRRHAARPAPTPEALLADKPDHLIPQHGVVPDYRAAGFRHAAPRYAFDQGELHNLSIHRGTLTEEERFKINEHVMQTILMLRRLPLPPGLHDVAKIAGAHHEQLNGGGYPVGLRAEQLDISQRILAVADVFEALTARDRPYKSGKSLAETRDIMRAMAQRGHLDPALVELLSESGVAAAYGDRHGMSEAAA